MNCQHQNCFCSIIPPHLLSEIVYRNTGKTRENALQTLITTEQFRGMRQNSSSTAFVPIGQKWRVVFDARANTYLPGVLARSEGSSKTRDIAVNEAYDGSGATYDFYWQIYGRNSIDDRGMRLSSTVHYGKNYDNAFWNGYQMVYGDGDGIIFERFTKSIDIIAHELTHGITQREANLAYYGQSGALNESMSDVFGSLIKQWILKQNSSQADWIMGSGLFKPKIKGLGLRSLKQPGTAYDDPRLGKDPQPAHMDEYYNGPEDNGGVHINSGIPNYAFYLAASAIGGYAWERIGRIWYLTLRDSLRWDANFEQAAQSTIIIAKQIYGVRSKETNAIIKAWRQVGVIR